MFIAHRINYLEAEKAKEIFSFLNDNINSKSKSDNTENNINTQSNINLCPTLENFNMNELNNNNSQNLLYLNILAIIIMSLIISNIINFFFEITNIIPYISYSGIIILLVIFLAYKIITEW